MNMNLLLIIVLVVVTCTMVDGYKKGMVKEIISFVSLVFTCIVMVLIAGAVHSYYDGKIFNVIIMVLLLCLIGIVRHLLGVIFFSAKALSKLPIVHWADKLLGIVVGLLETILILWTTYTFVMLMDLGMIGQQILDYTEKSAILAWFYQHNYLAYFVEQISSHITFIQ